MNYIQIALECAKKLNCAQSLIDKLSSLGSRVIDADIEKIIIDGEHYELHAAICNHPMY